MARRTIRARFTREKGHEDAQESVLEIEPGELTRVFVAPAWLRDAGLVAWLLVGIVLILVGAVWLIAITGTIVIPVVTAAVVASVAGPVVGWLERRRVPRAVGAILVLLGLVLIGVAIGVIVLGGITSQSADISQNLHNAVSKAQDALKDLGVGDKTAAHAGSEASKSVSSGSHVLLNGIARGISELASLAVFASFTVLSLFFLLKDGPSLRRWVERHSGVSEPVARTISTQMLRALRGYFTGVTLVAAFNAVVIGVGALVIGVPLAGTIAIVTFLGAYIPYLGAWTAGAFAVLLALGAQGGSGAAAMAVIALLGNGVLQQMVQPFAMGAALDLHPLAVLIVTIAAGALFGMIGLVLAAPVTSAVRRIMAELGQAQAAAKADEAEPERPPPPPPPPPAAAAPEPGPA